MSSWHKTADQIDAMRRGGRILAEVLQVVAHEVKPGITTAQLSKIAGEAVADRGAIAAFQGYQGFPAPICISVNEEVVHGIPGSRIIRSGDIVGLDLGITVNGMVTDGAIHVAVGAVAEDVRVLLDTTEDALRLGIEQAVAGNRVGDISAAIEKRLRAAGLGVIEDLSGHGVGHGVHEEPTVPNFGRAGKGPRLMAGMTLAIEPMATLGGKHIRVLEDDWTIVTSDGSWSAQFEHTVLITEGPPEIFTTV